MFFLTCVLLPLCTRAALPASGQDPKLQQAIQDLKHDQSGTAGLVVSMNAELHSIKLEMRLRESELSKMKSDIKTLQEENTMLRHRLNSTSGDRDVNSTSGALHALSNDVIALKHDVTSIMSTLGVHNSGTSNSTATLILSEVNQTCEEITSVKTELSQLKSHISTLVGHETVDLKGNLTDVLNRLQSLETAYRNNSGSSTAQTTSIYYQIHLNPDMTVQSNGVLIFDTVTANVGNGYDVKTGVFTAPVEGKYLLWSNVLGQSRMDAILDVFLFQNTKIIGAAYCKVSYMMGYNTASLLTIAHLRAGDKILYRVPSSIMVTGKMYSNYGGVLLP